MNKKGIELSFGWIFAIIVGAAILVIALYSATKIIDTTRTESDAKISEQLGVLLTPVETSLEDSKYTVIEFPAETRVFNRCREDGPFGRQIISASVKSGIGEEFSQEGTQSFFYNKYLFSSNTEQGKKMYILSKSFYFPYKTANLIFAYTEKHCFVSPPREIEDELLGLAPENILVTEDIEECPQDSKTVCFGESSCDVNVNTITKTVKKDESVLHYEDSLMYGAVFADPGIYECQIKRLMKRNAELGHLYADKADFVAGKGCSNTLGNDLRQYASVTAAINSSAHLAVVSSESETLGRINDNLACQIF